MRFKLTIVLLLANLLVFFVLWRLDHPTAPAATNPKLIADDFIDIDRIVITNNQTNEKRELVLSSHDRWRIIQPVIWPANDFSVYSLISQLRLPEEKAVFPISGGEDLRSYGLDPPAFEIDLWSGKREEQVQIGKQTTLNNQIYVRNPADGLIRVVAQELMASLGTPLQDLQNPSVFAISFYDVQGLKIHLAPPVGATTPAQTGLKVVTMKKEGDLWRFDLPERFAADTTLVSATVQQLVSLKAVRFLPLAEQDAARQGLASPFMTVELDGEDKGQTLDLGNPVASVPDLEYYAKLEDSPTVFTVSAEPFSDLANALQALRERHFLKFDAEKVSTITARNGEHEVRVEKLETGANPWQIQLKDASGKPTPMGADTGVMQELFQDLNSITAYSFVTDAPNAADLQKYGLANPSHKITLQMQGDKPITLLIGENSEGTRPRYYAMLDGALFIYEISPDVQYIPGFTADPLDFRDRTLESLPAAAIMMSLKITQLKDDFTPGPVVFEAAVDAQKPSWAKVVASEPAPVRDPLLNLTETIKTFRVHAYFQDSFTDHFLNPRNGNPWPWRFRLDAGVHVPAAGPTPSQDLTRTYYFTDDKLLGGAALPQTPAIFTVPADLRGNLTALIGRGSPPSAAVGPLEEMAKPIDPRAATGPAPAPVAPAPPAPMAPVIPAPTPAAPVPTPATTTP